MPLVVEGVYIDIYSLLTDFSFIWKSRLCDFILKRVLKRILYGGNCAIINTKLPLTHSWCVRNIIYNIHSLYL